MDNVDKTLYIPLYGKALVSQKGILLHDPKAEEIWANENFPLKGKAKSKWLAYYMGMRSAVFDRWLRAKMEEFPDAVIIHAGCGMDSRICRIGAQGHRWFDMDFPEVIAERKRYYQETEWYRMLSFEICDETWMKEVPKDSLVIFIAEGVSMYLSPEKVKHFVNCLKKEFRNCYILLDFYTVLAAKASRYKNPINDVGVTQVYGLNDPAELPLTFVNEHTLTPQDLIDELDGLEKRIFKSLYAGSLAGKLYRLYEFTT